MQEVMVLIGSWTHDDGPSCTEREEYLRLRKTEVYQALKPLGNQDAVGSVVVGELCIDIKEVTRVTRDSNGSSPRVQG